MQKSITTTIASKKAKAAPSIPDDEASALALAQRVTNRLRRTTSSQPADQKPVDDDDGYEPQDITPPGNAV